MAKYTEFMFNYSIPVLVSVTGSQMAELAQTARQNGRSTEQELRLFARRQVQHAINLLPSREDIESDRSAMAIEADDPETPFFLLEDVRQRLCPHDPETPS